MYVWHVNSWRPVQSSAEVNILQLQQDTLKHCPTQRRGASSILPKNEEQSLYYSEHSGSAKPSYSSLRESRRIVSAWSPLKSNTRQLEKRQKSGPLRPDQEHSRYRELQYKSLGVFDFQHDTDDGSQLTHLLTDLPMYNSSTELIPQQQSCCNSLTASQSMCTYVSCRLQNSSMTSGGAQSLQLSSRYIKPTLQPLSDHSVSSSHKFDDFDSFQRTRTNSFSPPGTPSPITPALSVLPSSTLFGQEISILHSSNSGTKSTEDSVLRNMSLKRVTAKLFQNNFERQMNSKRITRCKKLPTNTVTGIDKGSGALGGQVNKAVAGMFFGKTSQLVIK